LQRPCRPEQKEVQPASTEALSSVISWQALTAVAVEAVAHPEGLGIERLVLAGVDA
jgi:hypothetical protein